VNCEAILSKFLSAQTLEERRPLMTKSRRSEEELAAGPLAKPLPRFIPAGPQRSFPGQGRLTDSYHSVIFENFDGKGLNFPMLVRLISFSAEEEPRVQTDPFLDLYENIVAQIAKEKKKGPVTVNAIIQTSEFCFSDGIPNPDTKATVNFRANIINSTPHLASAYLRADSDLFKSLRARAPSGASAPVILTVEWNDKEDPNQPYVEVVRLNDTNW